MGILPDRCLEAFVNSGSKMPPKQLVEARHTSFAMSPSGLFAWLWPPHSVIRDLGRPLLGIKFFVCPAVLMRGRHETRLRLTGTKEVIREGTDLGADVMNDPVSSLNDLGRTSTKTELRLR